MSELQEANERLEELREKNGARRPNRAPPKSQARMGQDQNAPTVYKGPEAHTTPLVNWQLDNAQQQLEQYRKRDRVGRRSGRPKRQTP